MGIGLGFSHWSAVLVVSLSFFELDFDIQRRQRLLQYPVICGLKGWFRVAEKVFKHALAMLSSCCKPIIKASDP